MKLQIREIDYLQKGGLGIYYRKFMPIDLDLDLKNLQLIVLVNFHVLYSLCTVYVCQFQSCSPLSLSGAPWGFWVVGNCHG